MKKVILSALLASVSLMAADSVPVNKDGVFLPINGAALYKQHCALCHGERGEKTPQGSVAITGMVPIKLALDIRAYRDQNDRTGAYEIHKDSRIMKDATVGLTSQEIGAVAEYVHGLK